MLKRNDEYGITAFGDEKFGFYYEDAGGAFKTTELIDIDEIAEGGTYRNKPLDDFLTDEITHEEFMEMWDEYDEYEEKLDEAARLRLKEQGFIK
jgi:hypothetical protein